MIEATVCFVLDEEGSPRVLLAEKKRGFGKGKLNGPGGKLHDGETPEDGVVREVHEEVGITICRSGLQYAGCLTFRFPSRPTYDHRVHVFRAVRWRGTAAESEEMKPEWFSVHDLPFERMWQDDAYWLPLVLNGKQVNGTFVFGQDNESVVSWSLSGERSVD